MTISFILNGEDVSAKVRSGDRLSDILRERFRLLGVHSDCRCGRCGRCLIFLDGALVNSCLIPAFQALGREIVTIEGFSQTDEYRDILEGFKSVELESCGFCDNAKTLATADLLERAPRPTPAAIREALSSAPCRCTDPERLVRAVVAAAELRARRLYHRAG
jgi:carbon-monoxide dehydrogenase small subunit